MNSNLSVSNVPGLSMSVRRNANGRSLGHRVSFIGDKSASALKAEGKASGLKGAELKEYVNASLRGDSAAAAWVRHDAMASAMRSSGFVPEGGDLNKKGDVFKATYRNPGEAPKAKEAEIEQAKAEAAKEEHDRLVAKLMATGMDEAAARAILS